MRLLVCALLVIAITDATNVCEPDSVQRDGPNTCFCLGDGSGWVCIEGYPRQQPLSDSLLRETREVDETEAKCETGKLFKSYCNSCFCGADGQPLCTMMWCSPGVWNKDGSLKQRDEAASDSLLREAREVDETEANKCEPGKLFKSYCNSCFCGTDGQPICTMMWCSPGLWNKDGSLKQRDEAASDSLLSEALEVNENEDTCEPGKPLKYYCNSCSCGADGKIDHSTCTRMYCNPEIWNKDGSVKRPSGAASNSLLREAREVDKNEDTCEPGKRFNYYCNSCFCEVGGRVDHSTCTRKYCNPEIWNRDGTRKLAIQSKTIKRRSTKFVCQPGRTYNDDCNTCTCNRDGTGSVCTLMLCDTKKHAVEAPKVCEPLDHFYIDCNLCFCSEDGLRVACTDMGCPLQSK